MTHDRSTSSRPLAERGAITWVTLLLLLGLGLGGYLAWMWGPAYLVHFEVKQVVREYGNQAVRNPDDRGLVESMVQRIRSLDRVEVMGEDGKVRKEPAVDLRPQDVTWERLRDPPSLHVAFEYARLVPFPLLERTAERTFRVDVTMDVSRPDWGSPR
jgi:hypothetical protein